MTSDDKDCLVLALAIENAKLRAQLSALQDQCVELAVDAGELHAELEVLRQEVCLLRVERDRYRRHVA